MDLSPDKETGDTLDDEAMGKMVLDVGTEYDPPFLAINYESTPVPLFA